VEALGRLLRSNTELPPEQAVRQLAPALSSSNATVRRMAVEALGELHGVTAIEAVTKVAGDSEPEVQRAALAALGRQLHSADSDTAKASLPALRKFLEHPDPQVRRQLVRTLGSLRAIANDVVPLLARAVEDPDPAVQREAVQALGHLSTRAEVLWKPMPPVPPASPAVRPVPPGVPPVPVPAAPAR
jgi:HEAT repeat protein